MNSVHLSASGSTSRRLPKSKQQTPRKTRGRPKGSTNTSPAPADPPLAAAGSLTRTKALLLAALRVWELKHRIGD